MAVACCWLGACGATGGSPPGSTSSAAGTDGVGGRETSWSRRVSARFTTTYRARFGDGSHDHDLTETVDVDVGDPLADDVTFHALVHGAWDFDGGGGGDSPFYSLADTYDHRLTGRIHHLYADAHGVDGLAVLRVGRQLLYDTPETMHFDGLLLESEPQGARALRVGAWGGVPALPYESSRDGDLAAGAYAVVEPTEDLSLRADAVHLEDGEDPGGDDDDDLFALAGRWRPDPAVSLEASHSRLGPDPRDVDLAARLYAPGHDLAVEGRYYELLRTQAQLATPLDPFFTPLFEYHPFREAALSVSKGFSEDWYMAAGLSARRVTDDDDVGAFNRDFTRWYATASSEDLLPKEVALAVTAEVWDGEGDRYETWGLDLSRELAGGWRVDAGSFYSLYKYVLFLDEEREDVRTWYVGLRRRVSPALTWRLRYELEENDLDDFHTLRAGITWGL